VIVAIDGPAGSGKSSTARAVAERLGFRYLESGAFYRALTLAALRRGLPPDEWHDLTLERMDELDVGARPGTAGYRLMIGDEDVSEAIRSDDVTARVSLMARVPAVREWLLGRLRAAATTDLVADGRDMGTVVFPGADVKVFLTAQPAERARRRLLERGDSDPGPAAVADERRRLLERDRIDTERTVAPLRKAGDAVEIDTTGLSFDEQVDRVVALVRERQRQQPA